MSVMSNYEADAILWDAAMEERHRAVERRRPFMLLPTAISVDGNQWCVLYGENLQDGVAGNRTQP